MEFYILDRKDSKDIINLFYQTFYQSDGKTEADSVSSLVQRYLKNYPREDLKGFVASDNGEVLGCVFFSRLRFNDSSKQVYLLSPMAVSPDFQKRGIGQKLIKFAHGELLKLDVNVTVTYGDINFYSKSGYVLSSTADIAPPYTLSYPEGWLAYQLDGRSSLVLAGESNCIPELDAEGLW